MGSESKTSNLESDQKALLLRSVAQFLDRSGFSKCFKKLLSDAEIEKKELNSTTLPDLEEIFSEFLNKKKDQEAAVNVIKEEDAVEVVEDVKKEKKKKKKKETKVEVAEEEKVKETEAEVEDGLKEKKKKKKKSKSVEADDDDEERVSKKRKRSEPEETKEETEDDDEESKRRKKEEKVVEEDKGVQETPVKQSDIQENGNAEKSEAKSTNQMSGKGLSNSKEPKKPFQRVNVDDVVFTDERLRDNSYYALPNAEVGYGYKAQEILGQVRGRDFRHEKTKKKRGSYRGGQIDLQSHSIKFENSDEEKD
ncbi:PREDICTED: nucleolar and coiled-body phosphoprotein 1 [Camelina sativa]|uniref:Nucleolar and coiled-body phosphoprotein 1 n=1 Tax=Camelina sativa TaxID=90675 RepID=A0ABM0V6U3_CAMSA|nr:PREDICTED: nucleolar and coiled-body phosphoprotein 1 [Camelina sativa]